MSVRSCVGGFTSSQQSVTLRAALDAPENARKVLAWFRDHRLLLTVLGVSLVGYLIAWWFISPFVTIRSNPWTSSDTVIPIAMMTEDVPARESIFYWGQARRGCPIAALGKVFHTFFGANAILGFTEVCIIAFALLGFSVAVPIRRRNKESTLWLPLGLILVAASFGLGDAKWVRLEHLTFDLGLSPELFACLLGTSYFAARFSMIPAQTRRQTTLRALLVGAFAAAAAWQHDVTLLYVGVFAIVYSIRAAFLRSRPPIEVWVGFALAVAFPAFLRALSPEVNHMSVSAFASFETLREGLGTAFVNLIQSLTPATWLAVLAVPTLFVTALAIDRDLRAHLATNPLVWHSFALIAAGLLSLVAALSSSWLYSHTKCPRFFSPALQLICTATVQLAVVLIARFVERARASRRWTPVAAGLVVAVAIPFVLRAEPVTAHRESHVKAPPSLNWQSSQALLDAGCRGIAGSPYWNAYNYIVASPGKLKATTMGTAEERSKSNSQNALRQEVVCLVQKTAAHFEAEDTVRGVKLVEVSTEAPRRLPDGFYFKRYRPAEAHATTEQP